TFRYLTDHGAVDGAALREGWFRHGRGEVCDAAVAEAQQVLEGEPRAARHIKFGRWRAWGIGGKHSAAQVGEGTTTRRHVGAQDEAIYSARGECAQRLVLPGTSIVGVQEHHPVAALSRGSLGAAQHRGKERVANVWHNQRDCAGAT